MFKVSKRKTVALAIIGCALFSCSRNPEVKRIIDGVVPTDSISMRQVEIGTELLMPENIFVVRQTGHISVKGRQIIYRIPVTVYRPFLCRRSYRQGTG